MIDYGGKYFHAFLSALYRFNHYKIGLTAVRPADELNALGFKLF